MTGPHVHHVEARRAEVVRHVCRQARWQNPDRPRWTSSELQLLRRWAHLTDAKIAAILGRTERSVRCKRQRIELRKRLVRKWTEAETIVLRRTAPYGLRACREALPHRHANVILVTAKRLKIVIEPQVLAQVRHPILNEIRERARQDGITLHALDREIGATSPYFGYTPALRTARPRWEYITRAVAFFGGVLRDGKIDWRDE